jgi:sucrose-6-phosphate hydrolase SacC (GH32 family)
VGDFQPIYDPAAGEQEPWCLNDHTFVKGPDGLWHVFGITHIRPFHHLADPGRNMAHATATTLRQAQWEKQPFAMTVDPDRYDEHLFWAPHVVRDRDVYHMFVSVGARSGFQYAIHRYESRDLWAWERTSTNPVLVDGVEARDPMVLRDGDRWILYYTATSAIDRGHFVVAAVTSSDLIHWAGKRWAFVHPLEGVFGGPTESPFVVRRGKRYYLFITDDDVVHVYASDDPLRFMPEHHVLAFSAHASEVVRDEAGDWFISHAGWFKGALELAPLLWHDGLDDQPASIAPA